MGKLKMKHWVLFLLLGITIPAFAQQPGDRPQERRRREMPSPETKASNIIQEFKKAFQLTDKEYDKVYKLYLKHEKAIMPGQMGPGGMRLPAVVWAVDSEVLVDLEVLTWVEASLLKVVSDLVRAVLPLKT